MGSRRSRPARLVRSIDDMTTVVEALTPLVDELTRLLRSTRRLWVALVGLVLVIVIALHQTL